MLFSTLLSLSLAAGGVAFALPNPMPEENASASKPKATFPFDRMIAIGDNLSDNGNGSYAHGVQDSSNPTNTIYGYRTWTNGPVAVSYLSTFLGVPLTADYAFGEGDGGSRIGATINNSYTSSMYAQDAFQQVQNYTTSPGFSKQIAKKTLHFVWIGNNDLSLKHFTTSQSTAPTFASQMADQMNTLIGQLVAKGAENIFVVAIYPKNLSPSRQYLASTATQIQNFGMIINEANLAIKKQLLASYGSKVIYYDAYKYMTTLYNDHDKYGIDYILPDFCDGYSQKDWNTCVTQKLGDEFYWMQQTDPTTRVHYLVAKNMAAAINRAFT